MGRDSKAERSCLSKPTAFSKYKEWPHIFFPKWPFSRSRLLNKGQWKVVHTIKNIKGLSSLMKTIMGNHSQLCGKVCLFPKAKSPSVNGRCWKKSNPMLSCRPDEIAICRQVGLISDDELGVRTRRKEKKRPCKAGSIRHDQQLAKSVQIKWVSRKRSQCSSITIKNREITLKYDNTYTSVQTTSITFKIKGSPQATKVNQEELYLSWVFF